MRIGDTEFDPVVVGTAAAVGALAVAVTWLLRPVLLEAPSTAGPLLLTVWIGGLFLVVAVIKRREEPDERDELEDPWER